MGTYKTILSILCKKEIELEPDEERRRLLLGIPAIGVVPLLIGFGIHNIFIADYIVLGMIDLALAIVLIAGMIILRSLKKGLIIYRGIIILVICVFIFFLYVGGTDGALILWMFPLPLMIFFLMEKREGIVWALVTVCVSTLLVLDPGVFFGTYPYHPDTITRFIISYSLVIIFTYNFENVRQYFYKKLTLKIGELQETEKDLKDSKERYRVLIELLPEAIVVISGGKLLYLNPKALEVFHAKTFEEVKHIPIVDFIHLDCRERVLKRFYFGMEGRQIPSIEEKLITLDQKIIDAVIQGESIIYHNQKAILLIMTDITELKKSKEIQKTNEQLILSNENLTSLNQSKDELISLVSHELRTPITSIMGFAETLLDCEVSKKEKNEFLTTIIEESERLARLIENFLDVSRYSARIHDFRFKEEKFNQLLGKSLALLKGLADEKNISIQNKVPLIHFVGDGERIIQVLLNLIGNSIKFSPPGGTVIINSEQNKTDFKITIEDEGGGIPVDEIEIIFDKLHKKDRNHGTGGAGLGLHISRQIIEGHRGIIAATNASKGALFHFRLFYDQPGKRCTE